MALSSSEENARKSPAALPTPTITQSAAFATPDINSITKSNALLSTSSSPTAPRTPSSTESHAPATSESSSKPSTPAPPVLMEPNGTVRFVTQFPLEHALLATSTMKTSISANLQLLPAVITPTSTEPPASASQDSTLSTEFARNALKTHVSMEPSVPQPSWFLPTTVVPTRSQSTESAFATRVST